VSRPLGVDLLDARPQPDDTPEDSWARAMFAAHDAFAAVPGLRGKGEPRWMEALQASLWREAEARRIGQTVPEPVEEL
jgi:hypothetical protein